MVDLTLAQNATNLPQYASFVNQQAGGYLFTLIIVATIVIIAMWMMRNNVKEMKAIFFALAITLAPTVLLRTIVELGAPLIPDWYVILHVILFAITGTIMYLKK